MHQVLVFCGIVSGVDAGLSPELSRSVLCCPILLKPATDRPDWSSPSPHSHCELTSSNVNSHVWLKLWSSQQCLYNSINNLITKTMLILLLLKLWIMWGISFWVIMKWNTPVSMCVHSVLERLQILTVRSWDALANSWPSQENTHDFTGPADHYTFNAFLHT